MRPLVLFAFSVWVALLVALTTFESLLVISVQYCPPPQSERATAAGHDDHAPPKSNSTESVRCNPIAIVRAVTDPERITAWGTIVIALFTIVLGVGTWFLVRDGREHSRRQLRAYIGVKSATVVLRDNHSAIDVHFYIENYGLTPAYDVAFWASLGFQKSEGEFPSPIIDRSGRGGYLAPRMQHIIVRHLALSTDEAEQFRKAQRRVFFCARFEFIDAFDANRHWEIQNLVGLVAGKAWALQPVPGGTKAN